MRNLWLNDKIEKYSPNNFKDVISEMNSLFAGVQANDSKDLILFLLETMHNELNNPKNNSTNKSNQNNQINFEAQLKFFSELFVNNYQSIISELFYGSFNSMMECFNCRVITHNIQCFNLLIFPLEEVRKFKGRIQNIVNINECFEYYQRDDLMMGENKIYCNKCKSLANSRNTSKIIVSSNVLVINLNRGKGLQYNIKINFGEFLDIKNFVYHKDSPFFYELIGIVSQFGPPGMSGHYIAFCKSFVDHQWYKYNDSLVNPSSFQEASTTGVPYILFYSLINT